MADRGRKSKLDTKIQKRICTLLAKGVTDAVACADAGITTSTFYNWIARGKTEDEGEFFEFSEAVNKARAKAHTTASNAFYTGLTATRIKEKITETFTETRLDKNGKPYEYKRETIRDVLRIMPPDWRAGEAWLKRRDKENWSDKTTVEVEDWRTRAIADIRAGNIAFDALAEQFDESLAAQLFREAGIPVPVRTGAPEERTRLP